MTFSEKPRKTSCTLVRLTGLEPAHQRYRNLNPARLPIPPKPHLNSLHYKVSMNEMQEGLAVIGSTGVAQYSSYLSPSGLDPGAAIENVILRAAPAS